MKAATELWSEVTRFGEVTLVVLAEQSQAQDWQNCRSDGDYACLSVAVHTSAYFVWVYIQGQVNL
jgi:hypothetical protein